ncbi:hypothetical protein JCGZ_24315 [Jatropha curcas]|uniref:Aminotransferase-like plant mobile domain-containing protein n=1 Tax=Jatropha curcas TaxID=180498 RepID=A0A067JM60_JATCU|nr:hypothetical protein JCGZ_24315 [Jatropha curcas]
MGVRCGKSRSNTFATNEWFDWLPERVQERVHEVGFSCFVDTLPRVQGRTLSSNILALMECWMDSTDTFHLPFDNMTITLIDFAAIIELPFGGRLVDFDDRMGTLDCPGLWARAASLSNLYYCMDLCIGGAHLKIGYKWVIEIWACERKVLPMPSLFCFKGRVNARNLPRGRAWRYSRRYSHTTSDTRMFRQLLNCLNRDRLRRYPWGEADDFPNFVQVAVDYRHRRFLLPGLFYDMYTSTWAFEYFPYIRPELIHTDLGLGLTPLAWRWYRANHRSVLRRKSLGNLRTFFDTCTMD